MYTPEIKRDSANELVVAITGYGFTCVQLDFWSLCGEEMPESLPKDALDSYARALKGVEVVAVTGTFNMAAEDPAVRRRGLASLEVLADAAKRFGCSLLTLCTGSRDENMWRIHKDNTTEAAWADMMDTMAKALNIAEEYDLKLGIEIEPANIVTTAKQAKRLFAEAASSRLGLIMDGANLFPHGKFSHGEVRDTINETFDLLGDRVVLAHGKDLLAGPGIHTTYTGNGIVDFPLMLRRFEEIGYDGPMILHGIEDEEEFPPAVANMKRYLEERA